jgi:hypothetical protein
MPAPPPIFYPPASDTTETVQLLAAVQDLAAATLAAAAIVASGKPCSANYVMEVMEDFRNLLHPNPSRDSYKNWKQRADPDRKI